MKAPFVILAAGMVVAGLYGDRALADTVGLREPATILVLGGFLLWLAAALRKFWAGVEPWRTDGQR
jgi:hypothetical protein